MAAWVVWACPLSVTAPSAGVLGAMSKPRAPAPGFSAARPLFLPASPGGESTVRTGPMT
jgi:hypothetical protein